MRLKRSVGPDLKSSGSPLSVLRPSSLAADGHVVRDGRLVAPLGRLLLVRVAHLPQPRRLQRLPRAGRRDWGRAGEQELISNKGRTRLNLRPVWELRGKVARLFAFKRMKNDPECQEFM